MTQHQTAHWRKSKYNKPFIAGKLPPKEDEEVKDTNLLDTQTQEEELKENKREVTPVDVSIKELESGGVEIELKPSAEESEENLE